MLDCDFGIGVVRQIGLAMSSVPVQGLTASFTRTNEPSCTGCGSFVKSYTETAGMKSMSYGKSPPINVLASRSFLVGHGTSLTPLGGIPTTTRYVHALVSGSCRSLTQTLKGCPAFEARGPGTFAATLQCWV